LAYIQILDQTGKACHGQTLELFGLFISDTNKKFITLTTSVNDNRRSSVSLTRRTHNLVYLSLSSLFLLAYSIFAVKVWCLPEWGSSLVRSLALPANKY
jgi:hypothetical protein